MRQTVRRALALIAGPVALRMRCQRHWMRSPSMSPVEQSGQRAAVLLEITARKRSISRLWGQRALRYGIHRPGRTDAAQLHMTALGSAAVVGRGDLGGIRPQLRSRR